jgi:lysine biosynthesis protein LysW
MPIIDIENEYDVLNNKDGDIMFSVLERDGEPDNPRLVYDGGEHALLIRNGAHTVILDYINKDVRPMLAQTAEVLIGEHPKRDEKKFVRDYKAAVKIVKNLREEYGSVLKKLEDEEESEADRLIRLTMQDRREKQRVVLYYTELANGGNSNAQYQLARLYLEDIGEEKDRAAAMEWLRKSAKQGHGKAIELLDYEEKNSILITEKSMLPGTEITCTQCGTIIKLKNPLVIHDHSLYVCPKCGVYYEYVCVEPPMDGGPDEWA